MNKEKIFKTLSKYKKDLENRGYNVIYIGLYGSQNYSVDDEQSDIDARAIILPSLHDIVFRKVTSKVIEYDEGAIDVKDIITFYDVIKKGNFSFIEAIDTKYSIGDKYIKELFKRFRPNPKSVLGAMYEKRKALTHMYPSKVEEFEKWECDPKQYHHIIRLYDLLNYNLQNNTYLSYLDYGEPLVGLMSKEAMIELKRNTKNKSKESMEEESDLYIERARALVDYNNAYEIINIDDEINKYIEKEITKNLFKTSNIHHVREVRTFDNPIPSKDLEKFKILENYKNRDISYIVYEYIDIL